MKVDWDHLKQLSRMENEEDAKAFDYKVWEIASTKDPIILEHLIDLFDDDCEYPEVMYSLVHAVETYPDEVYVQVLLKKIASSLSNFPFWFSGLISAIFNSENCLSIFKENMHLAPKESLLKLFDLMEKESPHHKDLIQELMKELEQKKEE